MATCLTHLSEECLQFLLTIVVLDVGHIHCSPAVAMRTLRGREVGKRKEREGGKRKEKKEGREGEKIPTNIANCIKSSAHLGLIPSSSSSPSSLLSEG